METKGKSDPVGAAVTVTLKMVKLPEVEVVLVLPVDVLLAAALDEPLELEEPEFVHDENTSDIMISAQANTKLKNSSRSTCASLCFTCCALAFTLALFFRPFFFIPIPLFP